MFVVVVVVLVFTYLLMDSSARVSKVNPIGCMEGGKEQLGLGLGFLRVGSEGNEEETLLGPKNGDQVKEEVKPKKKRNVQWSDDNGDNLVEIMEFFPR